MKKKTKARNPEAPTPTRSWETEYVYVCFEVRQEVHEREKFQKAGHFLPGLTNLQGQRREWEGEEVYSLELHPPNPPDKQILRVLSDSEVDAKRLMAERITDEFFRLATTEERAKFQVDAHIRLMGEHAAMKQAMIKAGLIDALRQIFGHLEAAQMVDDLAKLEAFEKNPPPEAAELAARLKRTVRSA